MKIQQKTIWISLAVLGTLALLFYALLREKPVQEERKEQTSITLVYAYQNSRWSASIEEVAARLSEQSEDIIVNYEVRYAASTYENLLNQLVARDELGDIVQLKEPYAYAQAGLIAPLPVELAEQVEYSCELDGAYYAVAALSSTTGIVYNKEIFTRYGLTPPETYADFLRLCATLKRRGITPLGVGGRDLWHMEYWMNHFLRADVLSVQPDFLALCKQGERSWLDGEVTEMLTHLSALFTAGYVDENWMDTPDGALAYRMAEGELAMVFSGPWLAQEVQALNPALELGWFYVPNEEGTVVAGESIDVFWAITAGCARDEERYAAALAFLELFYSDSLYPQICAASSAHSVLRDDAGSQWSTSAMNEEISAAYEAADLSIHAYVGDEHTPAGFEPYLLSLLVELCSGKISVEGCQIQAQAYWEQCLQQEAAYE